MIGNIIIVCFFCIFHYSWSIYLQGSLIDYYDDFYSSKRCLEVQESKISKAPMPKCSPSPQCDEKRLFNKYDIFPNYAMSNSEQKILMELSPKASCTSATMMFLKSVGFENNVHYFGWPHDFRFQYYYHHCGLINPCMYTDDSWIRFKVVRNPFDRVVSSYIHCMKTDLLLKHAFHENHSLQSLFSFENFVDYLSSLRGKSSLQNLALGHFKIQSTEYELDYYLNNRNQSLFHVIIQIENPFENLKLLNQLIEQRSINSGILFKNISFVLDSLPESINHYINRTTETTAYVGHLPWSEIKHQIPSSYKYFFREPFISQVKRIYADDLFLYNYSYPFD